MQAAFADFNVLHFYKNDKNSRCDVKGLKVFQ